MTSLIEKLYSDRAVELIRDLYYDDVDAKESFYEAFGNKILEKQDIFLNTKPLDLLMLICNTAKFANSIEECHNVAVIVFRRMYEPKPLPYILDDYGLDLAEKSFISLSYEIVSTRIIGGTTQAQRGGECCGDAPSPSLF